MGSVLLNIYILLHCCRAFVRRHIFFRIETPPICGTTWHKKNCFPTNYAIWGRTQQAPEKIWVSVVSETVSKFSSIRLSVQRLQFWVLVRLEPHGLRVLWKRWRVGRIGDGDDGRQDAGVRLPSPDDESRPDIPQIFFFFFWTAETAGSLCDRQTQSILSADVT